MANNQNFNGMWTWLGVVGFVIVLVVSAFAIYPAQRQYERQKEFYMRTRAIADAKRAERDALQREVAALQRSPKAVEKIAREKFRLCKEGEVIMYYKKPR